MTSIGEKAEHVREALRSGKAGNHHCHWPGCKRRVPPAAWGCRDHWYKLPKALRDRIWRAYRLGQEDTKTPTASYVAVARDVQEWISANHPETKQGGLDL